MRSFEPRPALLLIGAIAIGACGTDGDKAADGNPDAGSGGASASAGGTAGSVSAGGAAGSSNPAAGGSPPGNGGTTPGSGGATPGNGGAASGGVNGDGGAGTGGAAAGALTLTSTVFQEGATIPGSYRCAAPSPDLDWDGGPAASSYAIVFKDVTAGFSNGFLHWVLYDVPSSVTSLAEGVPVGYAPSAPAGAHQAPIWNRTLGFNGPCGGMNTYELTLYAVDVPTLPLTQSSSGAEAVAAIEAHDLASVTMTVRSQP